MHLAPPIAQHPHVSTHLTCRSCPPAPEQEEAASGEAASLVQVGGARQGRLLDGGLDVGGAGPAIVARLWVWPFGIGWMAWMESKACGGRLGAGMCRCMHAYMHARETGAHLHTRLGLAIDLPCARAGAAGARGEAPPNRHGVWWWVKQAVN